MLKLSPMAPRLLDAVAAAGQRVAAARTELDLAREQLRVAVAEAAEERIPGAAIARAAQLSRQRVFQLIEEAEKRGEISR